MKVGDRILGYTLVTNGAVSSGRCTWAFAEKDGKRYFVKQFNSPKYPINGSPGSTKSNDERLRRCRTFEAAQRRILESIRHKIASGGSIVAPVEFGRAGAAYYKVYDRIDVANLTPEKIAGMASERKFLIMRVVAHSLSILHKERIVHGDLKPANILIKISDTGVYTSKLIDFDDSYFDGEPPDDAEMVVGDPAYYSPELLDYILTNDPKKRVLITTKSDIFALGLIFSEYWTGGLPTFDEIKFSSCAAAALGGAGLSLPDSSMPVEVCGLIKRMIQRESTGRPTALEVLAALKSAKADAGSAESTTTSGGGGSRLIRKGVARGTAGGRVLPDPAPSLTSGPVGSRLIRKPK